MSGMVAADDPGFPQSRSPPYSFRRLYVHRHCYLLVRLTSHQRGLKYPFMTEETVCGQLPVKAEHHGRLFMISSPSIGSTWTALEDASAILCTVIALHWHQETRAMCNLLKRLEVDRDTKQERSIHVQQLVDDNLDLLPNIVRDGQLICMC